MPLTNYTFSLSFPPLPALNTNRKSSSLRYLSGLSWSWGFFYLFLFFFFKPVVCHLVAWISNYVFTAIRHLGFAVVAPLVYTFLVSQGIRGECLGQRALNGIFLKITPIKSDMMSGFHENVGNCWSTVLLCIFANLYSKKLNLETKQKSLFSQL